MLNTTLHSEQWSTLLRGNHGMFVFFPERKHEFTGKLQEQNLCHPIAVTVCFLLAFLSGIYPNIARSTFFTAHVSHSSNLSKKSRLYSLKIHKRTTCTELFLNLLFFFLIRVYIAPHFSNKICLASQQEQKLLNVT